mmetsp:Transcript_569/g.567  ORF Transcript_569/g.567 Transcript_569/m.567 type:complete len:89 (-) Transcript_569:860-1126(-)
MYLFLFCKMFHGTSIYCRKWHPPPTPSTKKHIHQPQRGYVFRYGIVYQQISSPKHSLSDGGGKFMNQLPLKQDSSSLDILWFVFHEAY